MERNQLEEYLSNGVERIVKGILKASLSNPQESLFMMRYSGESKKAREIRRKKEEEGAHIPPFLIASITTKCNLYCKGCYARANQSCKKEESMLSCEEWGNLFDEAQKLGIGFILLAGGEPFLRRDVLKEAGKYRKILFPVFTNGTMIDEEGLKLLEKNRNLIPVLSIEGNENITDERRGEGIYKKLSETMNHFYDKGILFGASVTVTKNNIDDVFSEEFIQSLKKNGCKGIVYVEYVPVNKVTKDLAPDDEARAYIMKRLEDLRMIEDEMVFVAFPGDEKSSGGCLAAGRGFFHINAYGGAEPCPFSSYSDTSLREVSLFQALKSPLFMRLKENGNLEKEHIGGCVLFEQEEEVRKML
ncbi:MAG: radical SAM/SPASM domain-containing protein [Lachnospiraceae bacterium]